MTKLNNVMCGFSLIELLVALAIMSMTILISSLGYGFFMQKWDGQLGVFDQQAAIAKKTKLVQLSLNSLYPYILRAQDNIPAVYFEGDKDNFVGVTTRSIYNESVPAVIHLRVRQAEDLSYYISYQEAPIDQRPLVTLNQSIDFSAEFMLMQGLSDIQFEYFGFADLTAMHSDSKPEWWQSFNSLNRKIMPDIIRIKMLWRDKEQHIDFHINQMDQRMLGMFSNDF